MKTLTTQKNQDIDLSENSISQLEVEPPNLWILIGYYLSVSSFFPILGILIGPFGFLCAVFGLFLRQKRNETAGLWMGRIAIASSLFGAALQILLLYFGLFRA